MRVRPYWNECGPMKRRKGSDSWPMLLKWQSASPSSGVEVVERFGSVEKSIEGFRSGVET